MRLTVIGSGTVVPEPDRVCASYHVDAGAGARILLDCGPGALHHMARFGVPWSDVTHLVLSHFHTDHTGGVPHLLFSLKYGLAEPRRRHLDVVGPVGTVELFRRLAGAFGDYILEPGFHVFVREIAPGESLALDATTTLRAHAVPHTDAALAYRIETPDAALGYTGDTGPDDALADFLHGVDLLIAECSLPDDQAIPIHLSPSSVARLARRAAPRTLLLTHVYPQLGWDRVEAAVREAGWEGETVVARDGLRVPIAHATGDEPPDTHARPANDGPPGPVASPDGNG